MPKLLTPLDIPQQAAPANPAAGTRRLFVDSATGKLSARTSAGATVSLEEQGGGGGGGGRTVIKTTADSAGLTNLVYVDVGGLGIPVAAGQLINFEYTIWWTSGNTTNGVAFALNGPLNPNMFAANMEYTGTTDASLVIKHHVAYDVADAASTAVAAANRPYICRIWGVIEGGAAAGTLIPRVKSESATGGIVIKRGSIGQYV